MRCFTRWFQWEQREDLKEKGADGPGIYLLAHFTRKPEGCANPKDRNIIYIGETCRPLLNRWVEFDQVAFGTRLRGHSGAKTYREKFKKGNRKKLFVAALPISKVDKGILRKKINIRFLTALIEAYFLLNYILTKGEPPKCNTKGCK